MDHAALIEKPPLWKGTPGMRYRLTMRSTIYRPLWSLKSIEGGSTRCNRVINQYFPFSPVCLAGSIDSGPEPFTIPFFPGPPEQGRAPADQDHERRHSES